MAALPPGSVWAAREAAAASLPLTFLCLGPLLLGTLSGRAGVTLAPLLPLSAPPPALQVDITSPRKGNGNRK